MFVGVCRLKLHLSGNNSLKGKRRVVRSIVSRTQAKFNVSVAEIGDNDILRHAVIGAAVIGNSGSHVNSMLSRIGSFIEGLGLAPVANLETEVIPMGSEIGFDDKTWHNEDTWNDTKDGEDEDWSEEEEW
ncbi:MAG: DUF503 domain-containing protein [Deltaproteobacteria bacterium]|nr:DUF503 domain-containing protein [Deltaproteobacteria bacterium]